MVALDFDAVISLGFGAVVSLGFGALVDAVALDFPCTSLC